MRPLETTAKLAGFERRGPGTDAERRAARWLAGELLAERHRVRIEPFWCRPNWALAHAWHVAVALAGSLLSVSHPTLGAALLVAALLSILSDALLGISPGRRLTPERASQNVVVTPERSDRTRPGRAAEPTLVRLIVTANYDAGRTALVFRDALRRPAAAIRRLAGPLALGWLGCLALAILWILAIAVIRATAHHGSNTLGGIQLPPTVALVLALALLLDAAAAGYGPAAGDNASGTAVAIALTRALAAAPPRNLAAHLVLQGAGEGQETGLRRYLRAHRRELGPGNTIVLGIAACGHGQPRWWRSDGRLIPIPYTRRLRELADAVANDHPDHARPHRGRGGTPALPARLRRLPAIAIGNLDNRGLVPASHQPTDSTDRLAAANLDRAVELGLLLIDAIDAELDADPRPTEKTATPA